MAAYQPVPRPSLLYYLTFNLQFNPVELAADLKEIKSKGYTGIIWQNNATGNALPAEPPSSLILSFCQTAAKSLAGLYIDLASFVPALSAFPVASSPPNPVFYQGEPIEPEIQQAILGFINIFKDTPGLLAGILVPALTRLRLPSVWYWPSGLAAKLTEKLGYDLAGKCRELAGSPLTDWNPVIDTYRELVAPELVRAQAYLKQRSASLLGRPLDIRFYTDAKRNVVCLSDQCGFDPSLPLSEVAEVGHAEAADSNPAEVVAPCKLIGDYRGFGGPGLCFVKLWGENFGTQKAAHSAGVIDYWVDLMCTFKLNWLVWAFARDTISFSRFLKKGITYPFHPSWKKHAYFQQKLNLVHQVTNGSSGQAPLGIVFPEETMWSHPEDERNRLGISFNLLIYNLLVNGYVFDIIPSRLLRQANADPHGLTVGSNLYRNIIYPFPATIHQAAWDNLTQLNAGQARILFIGMPALRTTDGKDLLAEFSQMLGASVKKGYSQGLRFSIADEDPGELAPVGEPWKKPVWETNGGVPLLKADTQPAGVKRGLWAYAGIFPSSLPASILPALLKSGGINRDITCPPATFINLAANGDDLVFSLCPAHPGGIINGPVAYNDIRFEIMGSKEALALRLNRHSREVVSHALFGEAEIRVEQ